MLAALLVVAGRAQAPDAIHAPATVRVLVLSLFHPERLQLLASAPVALDDVATPLPGTLDIRAVGSSLALATARNDTMSARVLTLPHTRFLLTVPGKLTRSYTGALRVTASGGTLQAVVTLPTELAVASIVAAESPAHAGPEALKAQSVASRSFLLAQLKPQAAYDTCDTTHCQFLRSPPAPASAAARATLATRGEVLTWRATPNTQAVILAAKYSRSCGGSTRAAPGGPGAYPFYSVRCDYCRRHPESWTRSVPDASLTGEQDRIAFNRLHGWSAIPSNTYTVSAGGVIEGRGTGHGIGLCQLGAADLARRGRTYDAILAHFYPNTALARLPSVRHP